jgi:CRP-like cAMP-binding protein
MTRFFRFLRLKAVSRENDRKMEEKRPSLKDIKRLSLSIPFFKGLAEDSLKKAITHIVIREHPANQVILLENDWGGSVYFIMNGWVKIRTHNADGKEITLNPTFRRLSKRNTSSREIVSVLVH